MKLAVVHFAQLDRNSVVKVPREKNVSPQLAASSCGIFARPVCRNRIKLACRRTGCVDVIYRDCYTQTCSFTMHPTVCKGLQYRIISLNLHIRTNDIYIFPSHDCMTRSFVRIYVRIYVRMYMCKLIYM